MFTRGEKIFSLFQSVQSLPDRTDLKTQWGEFFCYLFSSLLYQEGADPKSDTTLPRLSDSGFYLSYGFYHPEIGRSLAKGLHERFYLLYNNVDLSSKERVLLDALNYVFRSSQSLSGDLRGEDFLTICQMRDLDKSMMAVADHLSVMVGQRDFYHSGSVPRIHLSLFGNIYVCQEDQISFNPPKFIYGSHLQSGDRVTGLWALLSAMTSTLARFDYPGDVLGDLVTGYGFMSVVSAAEHVPLPRYAASLFSQNTLGINSVNPVAVSALFYKQFFYGATNARSITRYQALSRLLQLIAEEKEVSRDYLFSPDSIYTRLNTGSVRNAGRSRPSTPFFLKMAVEALDGKTDVEDADLSDTEEDVTTRDPQTEDGGYDPSAPVVAEQDSENSMDLVSFNKAGEGVNESLYRDAVVALNDRLQADPKSPVSPETKQALNQWVNGWLYRTAISATKDQIATLKLTQYLKSVSHVPTV